MIRRTKAEIIEWLAGYPDHVEIAVVDERGTEMSIQEFKRNPLTPRLIVDGTVATDLEMEWLLNREVSDR